MQAQASNALLAATRERAPEARERARYGTTWSRQNLREDAGRDALARRLPQGQYTLMQTSCLSGVCQCRGPPAATRSLLSTPHLQGDSAAPLGGALGRPFHHAQAASPDLMNPKTTAEPFGRKAVVGFDRTWAEIKLKAGHVRPKLGLCRPSDVGCVCRTVLPGRRFESHPSGWTAL